MRNIEKLLKYNIEKREIPDVANMVVIPDKYSTKPGSSQKSKNQRTRSSYKSNKKPNQRSNHQFERKKRNQKNIKKRSSMPDVIIKIVPEKISTKSGSSQKLKTRSFYKSSQNSNNQFDRKKRNPKYNNNKKKKKYYSKNRQKISSSAK